MTHDGALRLNDLGEVEAFAEKPDDPSPYNAFWVSLAFRRDAAEEVLGAIDKSARRQLTIESFEQSPLFRAPTVEVADCQDLGTWPAFAAFVATVAS